MSNGNRRQLAKLSIFGTTYLHRQNPYMIAWWSAAFPGFGHYMLNQYVRATLLTLSELFTNTLSHINEAIVFTFCGKFELAKSILRPQWVFGYLVVYFLAIWDSYRSAIMQNKICYLAELENGRLQNNYFHPLELQYLEQKNPFFAVIFSFFFPGMGQLYNHRFVLAFYAMFWWWFYLTFSRVHESLMYLILGNIQKSIEILDPHWLLFMPSVIGGSIYHAYVTAIEHNELFGIEQRQYLEERYADSEVCIFPQAGVQ